MSLRIPFPFSGSSRRPSPASPELIAVLDGLSNAALLIDISADDSADWTVRLANKRFLDLSLDESAELEHRPISELFPGVHLAGPPKPEDTHPLSPEIQTASLSRRNSEPLPVTLTCTLLAPSLRLALLQVQPAVSRQGTGDRYKQQLDALLQISDLWQQSSRLQEDQMICVGPTLTGAETLVVYRAVSASPLLRRTAACGADQAFPETLPAQDLTYLKTPVLWTPGTRTLSGLHRAARAAQFAYLATAPIGPPNAAIGLVAAGDTRQPDTSVLTAVRLLAAMLAGFSHQSATQTALQADLDSQRKALLVRQVEEEGAQEGIAILTPDLHISSLNMAAENILGYTNKSVAGQPADRVLIGSEELMPALLQAQQGLTILGLTEQRIFRRSGETFLANMRLLPVKDGNQVIGIVMFIVDLSEQENYKQHALRLENQAYLGEVMSVFAHEVRNPINNISTGLQVLSFQLPESNPSHSLAVRMQADCDRLEELMKSVLQFSKPTDSSLVPTDIENLLVFVMERQQYKCKAANVQTSLQVSAKCLQVLANARSLEQVFLNLTQNAIQAMSPQGGQLAVRIQAPDGRGGNPGYVTISVADTGPGIPKEDLDRIFTPFFTTKTDGTGLGLPITQRIVIAHHGNIRVESFPGGTVFTVELPAYRPNE